MNKCLPPPIPAELRAIVYLEMGAATAVASAMATLPLAFGKGRLSTAHLAAAVSRAAAIYAPRFAYLAGGGSDDARWQGLPRAAVIVPLINDAQGSGASILFQVRGRTLRQHPGEVCFPGVLLAPADANDMMQCGLREFAEETATLQPSLAIAEGDVIGALGRWHNRKSDIVVHPFVALLGAGRPSSAVPAGGRREIAAPASAEVDHMFLASLEDLLDEAKVTTKMVHPHWPPMPFYRPDGEHVIWGFTGYVLQGLLDQLGRLVAASGCR